MTTVEQINHLSLGEEIANSVSHGVAFVVAAVATPFLLHEASRRGTTHVIGASIFVASLLLLYLASTLYHALSNKRAKAVLRTFDHAAIYLLIAGTYTPFTLGVLHGALGWVLLSLVWVLAVVGIVLKAVGSLRHPFLSTGLYLLMGWLVVVAIRPLWLNMRPEGFFLLVAGGLAYTLGTVFYAAGRHRYSHLIFHLLVVAGSSCHFLAVWRHAA